MEGRLETLNSHPRDEEIAAYVEGRLAPAERASIEDHLAACAACRREVTEVGLFLRERRGHRRKWFVAAPVAAVAAAVILLVVLPRGEDAGPGSGGLRSGAPGEMEALARIEAVTPANDAAVHADSVRFVWRDADRDALYRLVVTDEAGETVWETSTADTVADPSPDIGFEVGRRYYWYVDALLPDGSEASTGAREFEIRAR